jgi:acylphosphatase
MKPSKRFFVQVRGRVQGVGFRFFTRRLAEKFDLCGWVRNAGDGCVELEVEGEPDALESFIDRLREGPSSSHISALNLSELPSAGLEKGFEIRM